MLLKAAAVGQTGERIVAGLPIEQPAQHKLLPRAALAQVAAERHHHHAQHQQAGDGPELRPFRRRQDPPPCQQVSDQQCSRCRHRFAKRQTAWQKHRHQDQNRSRHGIAHAHFHVEIAGQKAGDAVHRYRQQTGDMLPAPP
ncbi:hypothetical protein D3C85_1535770 [compost metagenome]